MALKIKRENYFDDKVFKRGRWRLTLFYSTIMALFLIVTIVSVYKSMNWAITSEQTNELISTANNVAESHGLSFRQRPQAESENFDINSMSDRLFYYAFDNNGVVLSHDSPSKELKPIIFKIIDEWRDIPDEVNLYAIQLGSVERKIMMTSHPIVAAGKTVGMVYVGKDLTTLFDGMAKATYAAATVALLSLLTASIVGYFMAGKAMGPLGTAYRTQRQFAADASHELRTPLAVVMASCDILENDDSLNSPFLRRVISDVRDEVKRMTRLVSDLLFVARSDNNAVILNECKFDLVTIAEKVKRLMQPLAEEKNINITIEGVPMAAVKADEEKISQLLLILVDNAVKYTNSGGNVLVSIPEQNSGRITFSVSDTGIGIPVEARDKIFERFYRVDKVRSREMGGNGLGLAIAHEIAEMYHGSIEVKSQLGAGSTFSVAFREN